MTDEDLDLRVADALFDAAASTPHNPDALNQIMRRATSGGRARRRPRGAVVAFVSAAVVAAGVVGVVVVRSNSSGSPASGTPDDGAATQVAAAPTTTATETDGAIPTPATVPGALFYDDATLLSQLYVGFGVGGFDDQGRMRGSTGEVEIDQAAVAECLAASGFEYHPEPPDAAEVWTTHPKYVLEPADFAAQYGFGLAAEALGLLPSEYATDEEFSDYYLSLGDQQQAYQLAEDQCRSEHSNLAEIGGPDQAWVSAHDYAWEQYKPIVLGDDRVAAALADWQACMAASGFSADDPATITEGFYSQLFEYEPWSWPIDAGTAEYTAVEAILSDEIATATAHATCVEPYNTVLRQAVLDHFDEYKSIFAAALESGVESGGVG